MERRDSNYSAKRYRLHHADAHVVVVAKDAGYLTTPAHGERCLVDDLDRDFFGRHRLAVIHRLDRQTSGLLVFARAPRVAASLAQQFARHAVEREYAAIVAGTLEEDEGTIDAPLHGKRAVTRFRVVARADDTTRLAVRLETGRRNQIRMHFAARGHPILGDTRFAAARAAHPTWPYPRLALHARTLGFVHPTSAERLCFTEEAPF